MKKPLLVLCLFLYSSGSFAQHHLNEDQLGAWYMYFFTHRFTESQWGVQGDFQYRSWDFGSDKEQLLARAGLTYTPKTANITFTLGYAHGSSGAFGESTETIAENRIYQDVLIPQKVGERFLLTHRLRSEQRWVEDHNFRSRYRYNLTVNVPLNNTDLAKNTIYLSLYNEIFINGQKHIGNGRSVEYFDRNRFFMGMGYGLHANLRGQLGLIRQATDQWAKNQLQVSLHHTW
jgi:hypothetical protein